MQVDIGMLTKVRSMLTIALCLPTLIYRS